MKCKDTIKVELREPLLGLPVRVHVIEEKSQRLNYGSIPPGTVIEVFGQDDGTARVLIRKVNVLKALLGGFTQFAGRDVGYDTHTDVIVSDHGVVTGERGFLGSVTVKGRFEV